MNVPTSDHSLTNLYTADSLPLFTHPLLPGSSVKELEAAIQPFTTAMRAARPLLSQSALQLGITPSPEYRGNQISAQQQQNSRPLQRLLPPPPPPPLPLPLAPVPPIAQPPAPIGPPGAGPHAGAVLPIPYTPPGYLAHLMWLCANGFPPPPGTPRLIVAVIWESGGDIEGVCALLPAYRRFFATILAAYGLDTTQVDLTVVPVICSGRKHHLDVPVHRVVESKNVYHTLLANLDQQESSSRRASLRWGTTSFRCASASC